VGKIAESPPRNGEGLCRHVLRVCGPDPAQGVRIDVSVAGREDALERVDGRPIHVQSMYGNGKNVTVTQ
jgi:hypothetical protein